MAKQERNHLYEKMPGGKLRYIRSFRLYKNLKAWAERHAQIRGLAKSRWMDVFEFRQD